MNTKAEVIRVLDLRIECILCSIRSDCKVLTSLSAPFIRSSKLFSIIIMINGQNNSVIRLIEVIFGGKLLHHRGSTKFLQAASAILTFIALLDVSCLGSPIFCVDFYRNKLVQKCVLTSLTHVDLVNKLVIFVILLGLVQLVAP